MTSMSSLLISLITSPDDATRNCSLDEICAAMSFTELLAECDALDTFRDQSENLYERVRALFFLYAIHRFHLPTRKELKSGGRIPFNGYEQLLHRRFEEAIDIFSAAQKADGSSDSLSSALSAAYHRLAFQTLADQVRRSVRTVRGNRWMFRMGHPKDQPLRLRRELLQQAADGSFPILRERTPVRMDLTHSAWSDIFFLGREEAGREERGKEVGRSAVSSLPKVALTLRVREAELHCASMCVRLSSRRA